MTTGRRRVVRATKKATTKTRARAKAEAASKAAKELAERALIVIHDAKTAAKAAEALENEHKPYVLDYLQNYTDDGKMQVTMENGVPVNGTLVAGTTLQLDRDGLHSDLTEEQWTMCHTLMFNEKQLEDLVAQGAIDPEVVHKHTKVVPRAPYVRVS